MQPLIINLAPTGMIPTRAQTPHVPLTSTEIADEALACAQLGVSMVHLHARDVDGLPTTDSRLFADIVSKIRTVNSEVIITATTSGRKVPDVEQRASSLYLDGDLRPDMASLTLGSMNFATEASMNSPATIMRLAEIMQNKGIRPELEVFDLGMINFAKILIDKGLISAPYYFNILLGNPATAQASMLHLATMVNELPAGSIWAVAGIGRFQTRANALGVVLGDGVRVGLEDNLWWDQERTQLATNAQLIGRVTAQAQALGRPIASALEVRQRLDLQIW
jgi:3-keto-5-aminohexanoate cleavage enzyme